MNSPTGPAPFQTLAISARQAAALAPHEGFHQHILAGDAIEAAYQAESQLADEPLSEYYAAVPMKALALAHATQRGEDSRKKNSSNLRA
jgi:hypothetical protein